MAYIPMIDTETGEIDHLRVIEYGDLRAVREYGSNPAPPSYYRDAHSWCIERARAERRQWQRDRNLPVDGEQVQIIFNSLAPDTNE